MHRLFACRMILTCWMVFWISSLSVGQQPATGLPPLGSFAGGPFDTVNLANLDVHFSIPVFSRAGKGISFSYSLSYDSLVWEPVTSGSTTSWQPVNSNWGWRAVTEAATGYVTYGTVTITLSCQNEASTTKYSNFSYHDPTGGVHPFLGSPLPTVTAYSVSPGYTQQCGSSYVTPVTNAVASDNSGYILSTNASVALGPATVNARGGLAIVTPNVGSATGAGSVTDANGNQISINSSGVIKDTLGTTALTVSGTPPGNVTYTYIAPSGGQASVTVSYGEYIVQTCFGVSSIGEYYYNGVALPNRITLPDGTSYGFAYEPTVGCGANGTQVTGRIMSVFLPAGGAMCYIYSSGTCGSPSSNSMMADGSPASMTRLMNDFGSWTYSRSVQASQQLPQTTTSVTDPSGNQTTMNFSGIYELNRTVNQGSSVLDFQFMCYNSNYNGGPSSCSTATVTPPITRRDLYDRPSNTSLQSIVDDIYDNYGNLTHENNYNYGTASNTNLNQVVITMNTSLCSSSSNNICDHPASVQILDGSSNQKALTNYYYYSNGNTQQVSKWVSGSTYLNYHYTYNTLPGQGGTLATAQDPNGTTTTYGYNGACNSAFPTSVSVLNWPATTYTYNCTGGVVTSVTDPNGAVTWTSYTKDRYFWRPESSTDPLGNTTQYNYYGSNNTGSSVVSLVGQVESVTSFYSSTVDTLSTPEIYGRPFLQQRLNPTTHNWDSVDVCYNGLNLVEYSYLPYEISTPGSDGGRCGGVDGPYVTYAYDALGRPTSVTDADGGTTSYTYSLNDVLVTVGPAPSNEHTKSRQLEYDAFGRVTSVCEVLVGSGSTCGQNSSGYGYKTAYQYDQLSNLTSVIQNTVQSRSFAYDGLSRMTQEAQPESGIKNYIYDSVSDGHCNVTSMGDNVERADQAGNITCYAWDGLHRLSQVSYPSGPNTAGMGTKYFYYDTNGVFGFQVNNFYGRMTATATGNYITGEVFSYDARGEVTDYYAFSPHTGPYWYHTQQSYYANGAVLGVQGFLGAGTTTPLSHAFGYTLDGEGRPLGVTDNTWSNTALSYIPGFNAASQPSSVALIDGNEAFSYDSGTGRMTQWASSSGGNSQSGTLTWNPNGTVQQLAIADNHNSANNQTCTYNYDDLGRLGTLPTAPGVSCTSGSTVVWQQTFSYDAWGNNTKSGSSNFTPGYQTNNWVNGFSYDGMGDVTRDNIPNTYAHDAEGRQVSVNGYTTTFDAFNRPVEVQSASGYTEILYSPTGQKFALMNGATVQKYFVPVGGGIQAVYNSSGLQYYRHTDWLGSSRFAGTPSGGVYYDGAYAPFGENYAEMGTTDRSFTGQTQDTTAGLYDFLFRQQSSSQSRWLVPDPAGLAAVDITNPQTWNRYAYVANNPLNAIDPLGLRWDCVTAGGDTTCTWYDDGGGAGGGVGGINPLPPPGGGTGGGGDGGDGGRGNSSQSIQNALKTVCGSLPSGSVEGVGGAVGYLGAPTGALELVTNYQTGQVSGFAAGGISAGWNNGGLSAAAYTGFVTGLNGANTNYQGGFTSGTLSVAVPFPNVGVQATGSSSSGGLTGTLQQMIPNGQVNSFTLGVNAGLIAPPVSVTGAVTNYSSPLQLGKYWTLLAHPVDAALFLANQACKAAGF